MKKLSILFLSIVLLSCSKTETAPGGMRASDPAQFGTPFTKVPAPQDAAIYQVNMRAFSAGGNLKGVTARIDSIKNLGVNVVYLMPVFPVGALRAFNSPYAVKDYKSVATEFGSLDDLRSLVSAAHERDMAVVLDWVANHTSWDNSWISNKAWYRQDDFGTILSPPNYSDVAQLNFDNKEMRAAMIEAMRYWVFAANIDGYRCDFADNVPLDFWQEAIASLKSIPGRQLLYFAEGSRIENFRAGFDFNFGFGFYGQLKRVYADNQPGTLLNDINKTEYLNVYGNQHVVRYVTNHDVNSSDGTPQQLFGGETGALGAFVIAAFMKGVPMIYGGQEVGTPFRITFPFTAEKINWSLNPATTAEFKRVMNFRNSSATIRGGNLFSYSSDDVVAFTRELNHEKVFVLVNLRNKQSFYTLPTAFKNTNWADALRGGSTVLNTSLTLQPYQYLVFKGQ